MQPFTLHTGVVAPLDRVNVDTDSITPARFLKRITRTGYEDALFCDWRTLPDGRPNPEFILNAPAYRNASLLVTGRNFGTGSSREHAVWALMDYGFRAVIAPSLADIFHKNCFESGLVPVLLPDEVVRRVMENARAAPGYRLTVDLERCEVWDAEGLRVPFVIHQDPETHAFRRHTLLNGLDEIGLTLQHQDKIGAYEERAGLRPLR
jgi:3-isopropylmalate/(R)-2-methylmalate dehydratase small subunit